MSLEDLIQSSGFLLDFQKKALTEKLGVSETIMDRRVLCRAFLDDAFMKQFGKGIDEFLSVMDRRVLYLAFLDEVFRKLFNKGIDASLSVLERMEIDHVLDDMVGEIND